MYIYTDGFLSCFSLADSRLFNAQTIEKGKPRFPPLLSPFAFIFPFFYSPLLVSKVKTYFPSSTKNSPICAFFWNRCGYSVFSKSNFHKIILLARSERSVYNSRSWGSLSVRVTSTPRPVSILMRAMALMLSLALPRSGLSLLLSLGRCFVVLSRASPPKLPRAKAQMGRVTRVLS